MGKKENKWHERSRHQHVRRRSLHPALRRKNHQFKLEGLTSEEALEWPSFQIAREGNHQFLKQNKNKYI